MTKKKATKEPKLEWRAGDTTITDGTVTVKLFFVNGKLHISLEENGDKTITMTYDHFDDLVDEITNTPISEYRV